MLLHDVPLVQCSLRSFFGNLVGNLNLAEIVQVSAAFQRDYAFVVEMQMTSERSSIMSEPGAMIAGKRVTRFHSQCQSKKNRLRVFQFIGKVLEPEQALHAGI